MDSRLLLLIVSLLSLLSLTESKVFTKKFSFGKGAKEFVYLTKFGNNKDDTLSGSYSVRVKFKRPYKNAINDTYTFKYLIFLDTQWMDSMNSPECNSKKDYAIRRQTVEVFKSKNQTN